MRISRFNEPAFDVQAWENEQLAIKSAKERRKAKRAAKRWKLGLGESAPQTETDVVTSGPTNVEAGADISADDEPMMAKVLERKKRPSPDVPGFVVPDEDKEDSSP